MTDQTQNPTAEAPKAEAKPTEAKPATTPKVKAKVSAPKYAVVLVGKPGRYSYQGKVFPKGEAVRVTAEQRSHLMATGMFEDAKDDEFPQDGEKSRTVVRPKKWRVGKFESKQDAQAYAKEVHGMVLDTKKPLKELNQFTLMLHEARERGRLGDKADAPDIETGPRVAV